MTADKTYDFEIYKRVLTESRSIAKAREAAGWKPSTASKCRKGLPVEWVTFTNEILGQPGDSVPVTARVQVISSPSSAPTVLPPEMIANQGRFARLPEGEVPNPEGGSKLASFRAGVKKKLASYGVEPIVDHMYKVASGETKNDSDAIRAATEIRDTIGEKPTTNVDMRGIVVMMCPEEKWQELDAWAGDDD